MLTRLFLLIFLSAVLCADAQDLHFSQHYNFPLQFTPAQTGAFQGDLRAMGIYRSQWTSVPVSYRTMGLAADKKVWQKGANTLAAGMLVERDQAGDGGLSWSQFGFSGAVSRALTEVSALSVGFGFAMVQRRVDISGLKFKNQWTGDAFDPALPTKENFNQSSGLSPTLSAGLNWRLQLSRSRTRADIGIGAFHLNRPTIGFGDVGKEPLPLRMSILANTAIQVNESFDIIVFALGQQMRTAREVLFGGGGRLWLIPGQSALQFTIGTRFGDAMIPALQYEFGEWTVGLSYDWNISKFQTATRRQGGFELAVVYRTVPPPPVKTFKSCPMF